MVFPLTPGYVRNMACYGHFYGRCVNLGARYRPRFKRPGNRPFRRNGGVLVLSLAAIRNGGRYPKGRGCSPAPLSSFAASVFSAAIWAVGAGRDSPSTICAPMCFSS